MASDSESSTGRQKIVAESGGEEPERVDASEYARRLDRALEAFEEEPAPIATAQTDAGAAREEGDQGEKKEDSLARLQAEIETFESMSAGDHESPLSTISARGEGADVSPVERAPEVKEAVKGEAFVTAEVADPSRQRSSYRGRGLLHSDPVTNTLFAFALVGLFAIYPAYESARRLERDEVQVLVEELEDAVDRPLAARSLQVREAPAVLSALEGAHRSVRARFYYYWLGITVLVGAGIGAVRRRSEDT